MTASGTVFGRRNRWPAVWSVTAILVIGCDGDTLYDTVEEPPVPPPTVRIVSPLANQTVPAGQPVQVTVNSTDSLGVSRVDLEYSGVAADTVAFSMEPPRATVTVQTSIPLPAGTTGSLVLRARSRNALGATGSSAAVTVSVTAPAGGATAAVVARNE